MSLGEHNDEILAERNVSQEEIDDMKSVACYSASERLWVRSTDPLTRRRRWGPRLDDRMHAIFVDTETRNIHVIVASRA